MDSLTQIVLGAAVGEAVLGKKVGNKAMLYGAIAGTIPDLDVLASQVTDTVTALEVHRGFTHSIFFSIVAGLILGWLVSKYETYKDVKGWSWLFFWCFVTHPILDAHTTWGTQLFWPFDYRLAFKTIFVIDPLYTLPFLVFLILALLQKREAPKRKFYNNMGLMVSSVYLLLTFLLKGVAFKEFKSALKNQQVDYVDIETKPAPFNTILWTANVDTKDAYLIGDYSFFDKNPIHFERYPKNHELIAHLITNEKVQRMINISKGWYTITKKRDTLLFNDLRFGLLSMKPNSQNFIFQYEIKTNNLGEVSFIETEKNRADAKQLLNDLWVRVKGN
ncbi:inner membrane protein [Mariniflexile fucanivorans]|uniref:Inner membrane protein n=1 Tax=Mariniflexile fucanivorans TaxID=264023 RepID=A0A4R1RG22_9FLAO|nr:metal-dependent hydrolase [Mariniflexile fucanivorans]TCL64925.1 inner membrane protein [Mariniflexile fucanivorans]